MPGQNSASREKIEEMKQLEVTNQIDEALWDKFVYNHPKGNIFQTSSMFKVFKKAKGYEPFRFWVKNSGKILGVLQGVIIREKDGLIGDLSSRAIIQGGPLVLGDKQSVAKELIKKFDNQVKDRVIWSEIRNLTDNRLMLDSINNYQYEDHLNFLIDISKSEEELWQKVRPTRRRNITRGLKSNRMVILKGEKQTSYFYRLLVNTYMRVKVPLADESLFKAVSEELVPKGLAKMFFAKSGYSNYTGGRLILIYKDTLYDWYAAARDSQMNKYPNDFLVWKVLQWGRENGYKVFDFGGAGKPGVPYGPRDFKRQFGGEEVNFGWPTKIYSPWKYKLAHFGLKLYQIFLPLIKK
jgi:lipid II:glycine glycyltransferase (peptidoglycan interpeptide bridge formation enzyme)